jgi:predicted HAD superfamily phosphohydrolase
MASWKLLEEINPIGGFEKAEAVKKSCERTGVELRDVMYAGDSITDMEAMKLVRGAGGTTVSFNGNRYAIEAADVACISPNALILAALAFMFRENGPESILDLASGWESGKYALENMVNQGLPAFTAEGTSLYLISDSGRDELVSRSEKFRKTVRGERIGRLG